MKTIILVTISAMLAGMSASADLIWDNENVSDSNTLLLYHMNGSGTILTDSGPKTLNGTLGDAGARAGASPSWMSTPSGDYLSQVGSSGDGMSANISVTGVDFDLGLTVSMWYRPRVGEVQNGVLFQVEGPGATPRASLTSDNFNPRLRLEVSGSNSGLVGLNSEGVWRNIAAIYDPLNGDSSDGGTWTMYFDGLAVGSVVNDSTDFSGVSEFNFRVGNSVFNNAAMTGADIDEVLVQNGVITSFLDGYNNVAVPEPATLVLVMMGLSFLGWFRSRR